MAGDGVAPSVLQVADYAAAYPGAFIGSLRALVGPCRDLGLRLAFAFSEDVRDYPWVAELRRDGFPVHILQPSAPRRRRVEALADLIEEERAAIVHSHFGTYDVAAALATRGCGHRVEVLWHAHNAFPPRRSAASAAKDVVKYSVLGRRAWVAAVSPALLEQIVAHGFPRRRARYVPNGVDLAHATHVVLGRQALRRQLGIGPAAQVVLVFGWDPVRKGVDVALEAVGQLAARGAEVVLLLVGNAQLEAYLHGACGTTRPSWLRTLGPQDHVGDLYAAADVFVSASRHEGFSFALGEALATGLAVVSSDIPGVQWAREAPGVRFFRTGDARSLASVLAEVGTGAGADRDTAHAARRFAEAHFSLEAWADRVAALYAAALAGERGRAVAPPRLDGALGAGRADLERMAGSP